VRHENELSGTTDVSRRPEYADRFTTKIVDGVVTSGWFSEDFTLAEIKTLRATERLPLPAGPRASDFDGMFQIPTLDEVIALVDAVNAGRGSDARLSPIGIYPETKHPTYFERLGLSLDEPLVRILHDSGYRGPTARAYVQSFEVANLRKLSTLTDLPLIQLLDATGSPFDTVAAGHPTTYAEMASPEGLQTISSYARGIGPHKDLILSRGTREALTAPSALIRDAHGAGLVVHPWTLRAENAFLPADFRFGGDARRLGDMQREALRLLDLGVDGFFTDHPAIGSAARELFLRR
jgi:glycerophosphoryl diester phosphodiesterase